MHSSDSSSLIDAIDRDLLEAFYMPPYFSSDEEASLDANLQIALYVPSTDSSLNNVIDELLDDFDES